MMKNLAIIATCLISFSLVSCNNEAYEDMVSNTDNEPSNLALHGTLQKNPVPLAPLIFNLQMQFIN